MPKETNETEQSNMVGLLTIVGDVEVCGRDEDLDVEGQNDEDDYDDDDMEDENFVLDYPSFLLKKKY
ncbi:hypothetical protein C5167_021149 [Papaver somniferum]|uniref:Uncharacterized protein n=1 Tax=Papaver somniferum TaxID=3469 RepID=A0A4Y7IVK8_PAPSO|nr:hypothetical protein C5167_021149 [Papaver somniferum]